MKYVILISIFVLGLPMATHAAITNKSSASTNGLSTGGSVALDCTGADLILAYVYGAGTTFAQFTSVTYNGTSMSALNHIDETYLTGGNTSLTIWGLLAPASGSHNVTLNFTGGAFADVGASCYSGTQQSGLPDATASYNSNDTATSKTVNITTVAANSWTFMGTAENNDSGAAGTGSFLRQNVNSGYRMLFDSNTALSAGSNSMSYTYASGATAAIMVSFAPAGAAVATFNPWQFFTF